MYSKLMIILTKNENVLSSKTINGSEMGNERGKGSIPLILFIKLRYSEFRILMPMVHVIPDWVPYALNHFLFKDPFINTVRIHQSMDSPSPFDPFQWPSGPAFRGLFSFHCSNWNFESQKFWMNNEKLYTFVIKKNFCTHQKGHRSMLVLYGNPVWVCLVPSRLSVVESAEKGQSAELGPELEIKSSYCYCPHPSEFWRSIFVFNHPGWMVGGGLNHKGRHFNFHFPLIQTPTMAPSK